jgi:hypothetical protein
VGHAVDPNTLRQSEDEGRDHRRDGGDRGTIDSHGLRQASGRVTLTASFQINSSSAFRFDARRCVMVYRLVCRAVACTVLVAWAGSASAQTWSPDQQEVWKVEEQQWQMAKDEDMSWIDKMVHPNLTYWETGMPSPQNRASLARWNRYNNANSAVLEQELYPISITITGNVAVVQYHYQIARENEKKERATVWGQYTDVLVKEGGRWLFLTWTGGDYPKK